MYRQMVSTFCGKPYIATYYTPAVERGQVVVSVEYTYFSTIDYAIARCCLVTESSMRVLGTSGSGRVVDTGIDADPTLEGKYVVTNPMCGAVAPLQRDGAAQDLYPVDQGCIHILPPTMVGDPLAPLVPILSASPRQLEELYGREVLVVGREIALLPYALYARRNASRLWIVAKHTLWPDIVGGEHLSIYDTNRRVDVVVIAEPSPAIAWLALSMVREGGLAIVYPSTPITVSLLHIASARRIRIELIELSNVVEGLRLLNELRNTLANRVKLVAFEPGAVLEAPSIAYLREQRDRDRKPKRFSK